MFIGSIGQTLHYESGAYHKCAHKTADPCFVLSPIVRDTGLVGEICVITHPRICSPWFSSLFLYKNSRETCTNKYCYVWARKVWPESRHGYTRAPGHDVLAWRSSWRMVVYIYYITAAGNSISSQLGSSCQGNWYSTEKAGGMAHSITRTTSHLPGQAGRRVGPAF
jgi:hypothetical protein